MSAEPDDEVRDLVRRGAPARVDDFWSPEGRRLSELAYGLGALDHWTAQLIDAWPTGGDGGQNQFAELIGDEARCVSLATAFAQAAHSLGFELARIRGSVPESAVFVSPCKGCNTVYDNGNCNHEEDVPKLRIHLTDQRNPYPGARLAACHHLHMTVKLLELMGSLLGNEIMDTSYGVLAQALAPEPPPGVRPEDLRWWDVDLSSLTLLRDGDLLPIHYLVGVIDKCAGILPKAAFRAAGVLSLVVCRRPSVSFSHIDPDKLCDMIFNYLGAIFDLVSNNHCIVEETDGVIAFINILPLLYAISSWSNAHPYIARHGLPAAVTSFLINILHSIHRGIDDEDDRVDRSPDYKRLPELRDSVLVVRQLIGYGARGEMLHERPMSFAVAAAIEVLGRWSHVGIPVSSGRIPAGEGITEAVHDGFKEYLPMLEAAIERTTSMAFAKPIAEAIIASRKADLPDESLSLLREPISSAYMCCALQSCANTAAADGGPLMKCSGGCHGLAWYCSREHHKAHWKQHKHFCKLQAAGSQRERWL